MEGSKAAASDLLPLSKVDRGGSITVRPIGHFGGSKAGQIDLGLLSNEWRGPQSVVQPTALEAASRRAFDVTASLVALVFTAPLFLLIAAAVAVVSPGPVFYIQDRVGLNGRLFQLIKFRSMRVDAEASGAQWASKNDPRVTSVGRLLRLTRLDELPQLLNVLAGSMSVVGPRPERPVFVQQLQAIIPHFDDRTLVRPGITGWAQVNYPYGASVEDAHQKLAYDFFYLKHRSMWLDLRIILRTVVVVCTQAGSR